MGTEPPKLHDIAELAELVGQWASEIGSVIRTLAGLTGWYISTRYPDIDSRFAPSEQDVFAVMVRLQDLRRRINLLEPKA